MTRFVVLVYTVFVASGLSSLRSVGRVVRVLAFVLVMSVLFFVSRLFGDFAAKV